MNKWLMRSPKRAKVIFIPKGNIIGFATRCEVNGKQGHQVIVPAQFWTPEYIDLLSEDYPSIKSEAYHGLEYYEQGLPQNVLGELYLSMEWNNNKRRQYFYITAHEDGIFSHLESAEQVFHLLGITID